MKVRRRSKLFAVPIAIGLLVSGCGSGAPHGSSGAPSRAQAVTQGVAFSDCMRSHGVPNFADPHFSSSGGGVQATINTHRGSGSVARQSPAFTSALDACRKFLPNGQASTAGGASGAQNHAQALEFATCMRTHGVTDYPDPSQGSVFNLPAQIDQQAPQFTRAERACSTQQPNNLVINQGSG